MNEPWGISGPQFVALYITALVVATVVTFLLRRRSRHVSVPPGQEALTTEQVAYLAGGPHRMVDAALAELIERNAIRMVRHGRLHGTKSISPRTALESEVHKEVMRHPGRTVVKLRAALAGSPIFDRT